jgi:hypothetical protein
MFVGIDPRAAVVTPCKLHASRGPIGNMELPLKARARAFSVGGLLGKLLL